MSKPVYIVEASPYISMVVADLEHQQQILSLRERSKVFPFYERVFRTTMEVYKANKIQVESFELYEHPESWALTINGEMAVIPKDIQKEAYHA